MSRNNVYWDGSVHITYKDTELDVDVSAFGAYYYSPGTMYRRNGDPGDPPEAEAEADVDTIDIEAIYIDGVNILSWLKDKVIKEIEGLCQDAIEDGQLEMESYEPDYDDYEPEPEDY